MVLTTYNQAQFLLKCHIEITQDLYLCRFNTIMFLQNVWIKKRENDAIS
jgi:hypothetical protein